MLISVTFCFECLNIYVFIRKRLVFVSNSLEPALGSAH